ICTKLEEKAIVQYKEVEGIYLNTVQVSQYTYGSYWDNAAQSWESKRRLYEDWEVKVLVNAWLLRALGTLIKKGYLTVLPRIQFSELPQLQSE
ncbi:hypothetical protein KAR91_46075, partial [Candidatus Pacearchaeota archaeon]|nr:hypothetical protein [Candidatus Pacearchaeota archaeon]